MLEIFHVRRWEKEIELIFTDKWFYVYNMAVIGHFDT